MPSSIARPRRPLLLVALALLAAAACSDPYEPDRFPDPGHVLVSAQDAAGAPVADVVCDLWTDDMRLVWRSGRTGADGRVEIGGSEGGVLPGEYRLVPTPPSGYALAAGQAGSIPVSVRERATVTVTVRLARTP